MVRPSWLVAYIMLGVCIGFAEELFFQKLDAGFENHTMIKSRLVQYLKKIHC